jgi:hypothetical protein
VRSREGKIVLLRGKSGVRKKLPAFSLPGRTPRLRGAVLYSVVIQRVPGTRFSIGGLLYPPDTARTAE